MILINNITYKVLLCQLSTVTAAMMSSSNICIGPESILPIRRIRKLRRAPETPGGPLALKDVLILVYEFGKRL